MPRKKVKIKVKNETEKETETVNSSPAMSSMPTAGNNAAFRNAAAAIKEKTDPAAEPVAVAGSAGRAKRVRRTRDEIETARISDDGFEGFRDFLKIASDKDVKKWGLPECDAEFFEPLAKQYATIVNYFFPAMKPIYFVCGAAVFASYLMFSKRLEMIDALHPKMKSPDGSGKTVKDRSVKTSETGPTGFPILTNA